MTARELAAARAAMTAYAAALADHDTVMDLEAWAHHAARLDRALTDLVAAVDGQAPRQLERIRAVVAKVLADECADRQYALEEIEHILRGAR